MRQPVFSQASPKVPSNRRRSRSSRKITCHWLPRSHACPAAAWRRRMVNRTRIFNSQRTSHDQAMPLQSQHLVKNIFTIFLGLTLSITFGPGHSRAVTFFSMPCTRKLRPNLLSKKLRRSDFQGASFEVEPSAVGAISL